jgi:hypothetical protein
MSAFYPQSEDLFVNVAKILKITANTSLTALIGLKIEVAVSSVRYELNS